MARISQKPTFRTSLRTNLPFSTSQSRDVPTKLSSLSFFIAHENSIPTTLSLTVSPTPFTPSKNNVSTPQSSETLPKLDQLAFIDNIPSQPTSTDNTNSKRTLPIFVKIIDVTSNQPSSIPTDNNRQLPTPTDNNRQLPTPTDNKRSPNNNQPPPISTEHNQQLPIPTDNNQPPDNIDITKNQPLPTSTDNRLPSIPDDNIDITRNRPLPTSTNNINNIITNRPNKPLPTFIDNINTITNQPKPTSNDLFAQPPPPLHHLPPINRKHNKLKNRIFSSFSTNSRPFISPTITVTSNNTLPSPLPVNPPELIGIIIAAIIAIIVVVLIIKKITFGLDEMNDPLFDRHDLDLINLQQNQEYTSKCCKKPRFFDTLKRWFNNIFNRGNDRFRLNSLTSSVMNSMDTTKRFDKKKNNIVYMESEIAEDSGVGVSSMCETEISFPDIHSHVLNWEEYIL
ncbi:23252_t:CDS:2 [Cetraspora pellucida]|uniref:23252_t:CDS:1 n=1 Tax=Cetraspora pellucida TaxID=1433469 RepID=A0A9N9FCG1_9GLOM|nr:23252_t:CDS:2 [Cetraspora pellucida]